MTARKRPEPTIEEVLADCGFDKEDLDLEGTHQCLQKLKGWMLEHPDGDRNRLLAQGAVSRCKGVLNADDVRGILLPAIRTSASTSNDITVDETPPWKVPVDGAELLHDIASEVRRFFVIGEAQLTAVVLWIVHAHLHDASRVSPYLWLWSPVKGCGKSNLLGLIKSLVTKPLPCSHITPSALFRSIEKFKPTLLIDEIDKFLRRNMELRGIFQDGHRRGGQVVRSVPNANGDYDAVSFSTWAPRVMAGLGSLPSEITDRSIRVVMQMILKADEDAIEEFDELEIAEDQLPLKRRIVRWSADNFEMLQRDWKAEMPDLGSPRKRDNWRALITIADRAGGVWPELARSASIELSGGADAEGDDAIDLLSDVRDIFEAHWSDQIQSVTLLEDLNGLEDRKWPRWNDGQWPIKPAQLAELLKPFDIKPKRLDFGTANVRDQKRGYKKIWFVKVWERYLDPPADQPSQASQVSQGNGLAGVSVTGLAPWDEDVTDVTDVTEEGREESYEEDERIALGKEEVPR